MKEQLALAAAAPKCFRCGCLRKTVEALAGTAPGSRGELASVLDETRRVFLPTEYDCLGCQVCFPALAANAFAEAFPAESDALDLCPTESPSERGGWPPLPGEFHVVRYRAPVAVCALNSADLARRLAELQPEGVAIVGTLHTENLGIERIIRNVCSNPNIRFLVLCGEDTRQEVGHLPGQALISLFLEGLDDRGRIRGAKGKRPFLKNVSREQVSAFLRQVELVPHVGEDRETVLIEACRAAGRRVPGPLEGAVDDSVVESIRPAAPRRLVSDPAGFFVIYPDPRRGHLALEHYTTSGVLDCVVEGENPAEIMAEAIDRRLVSRLDHAAYLGRELARAEHALRHGEPYVQDKAPGRASADPDCSCASGGEKCR